MPKKETITIDCPNCDNGWLYPPNGKPIKCHRCGGSGKLTVKGSTK